MTQVFHKRIASITTPCKKLAAIITRLDEEYRRIGHKSISYVRHNSEFPSICEWLGNGKFDEKDMVWLYRAIGQLDLDWRDVLGAGHGRLLQYSKGETREKLLTGLSSGAFWGVAITETQGGSNLDNLSTELIPVPNGYRLSGKKKFIGRLMEAAGVVVLCKNAITQGLTAVLIEHPLDHAYITVSEIESVGLNKMSWCEIEFDDVFVPLVNRLGGEGMGKSIIHSHFSYWRVMMAACLIGAAESLIDTALDFAKERVLFDGGLLSESSKFQSDLGRTIGELRGAWTLVEDASGHLKCTQSVVEIGCIAKAHTTRVALSVVEFWKNTLGARAYMSSTHDCRQSNGIEAFRYADGATETLEIAIAKRFI